MAISLEGQINLILTKFGEIFKTSAKIYAAKYPNTKTGKDTLSNSELLKDMKVEVKDERLVISVYEYYNYIASGRKIGAKGIPIDVLIKWIKDNRIQGRAKNGQYISVNALAFIIQRSIKKKGISKRPFLEVAYKEASKEFDKLLNDTINAVLDDVLIRFTKNSI